ncbi:sugar phosphate nucleotidyltransferase [Saccharibacillus sp. JS10]|uniref:sugar phosphate nucleotidyltransferase n=1 Tax=Saccharibacillus sp. JS10 TaxID=2950552 RepID=UPI00210D6300|nr:sugar phosphate nucleotidyltransferase [Saccharibacillus sp. JS10]MCQ4088809.1 sugar phosphate nucleotidyltransferase [Saccharibacillus sp. JS10]
MKIVLLSGGSGKRLWPLSSDSRSKQFLKILPGPDSQQYESMVQRIWRQLNEAGLSKDVFITAGAGQIEILQQQLDDRASFIVEPERKDTLPAIFLSVLCLHHQKKLKTDEVVIVLPVDSYVDRELFLKLPALEGLLLKSGADIGLIGVKPTYPSAKYGYMIPDSKGNAAPFANIKRFVEKPSEKQAEELIAEGGLWNCGVFAFKGSYLLNKMSERGVSLEYDSFFASYSKLEAQSFDYEILETSEHIVAATYEGDWKDLGTWNTLTEEIADSFIGKGKMSADCSNTHVVNELGIPVHVLGISNAVVATSPEGILVTDKSASPRLKELLTGFQQRLMYEEKSWGWYKVIDHSVQSEQEYTVSKFRIFKDCKVEIPFLQKMAGYSCSLTRVTVMFGEGLISVEEKNISLKVGTTLELENTADSSNSIHAYTELEFMMISINDIQPMN